MPKTDIRIPTDFFSSPKVRRLQHAAGGGLPGLGAAYSFLQLCTYIRTHGDALNGSLQFNGEQDELSLLESEVEWKGAPGAFLKLTNKAGLTKYELNCLTIIDWTETFGSHAQLDRINSLKGTLGFLAKAENGGKDSVQYKNVEATIKRLQLDISNRRLEQTATHRHTEQTARTVGTATPNKPSEPLEPSDHPDQAYMFDDTHSGNVVSEDKSKISRTPAPETRNQKPETSRQSPAPPRPDKSDISTTANSEQRSSYDTPAWIPVFKFLKEHNYTDRDLEGMPAFIRQSLKIPMDKIADGPAYDFPLFRLLAQMAIAKQLDIDGQIKKSIMHYLRGCKGEPSDKAQASAKREFLKIAVAVNS